MDVKDRITRRNMIRKEDSSNRELETPKAKIEKRHKKKKKTVKIAHTTVVTNHMSRIPLSSKSPNALLKIFLQLGALSCFTTTSGLLLLCLRLPPLSSLSPR